MEKDWKKYNDFKDFIKDNEPENSYIKMSARLNVICKKCGSLALIWHKYRDQYNQEIVIKCEKCYNEQVFYGSDG